MTEDEIGKVIENHEALAWSSCVAAASQLPRNPLRAIVDNTLLPLSTVAAFNFATFNRVVALGVATPSNEHHLEAISSFYDVNGQTNYSIEVSPVASPKTLSGELEARGLVRSRDQVAKYWREAKDPPKGPDHVMVRDLREDDRDALAAVNVAAWNLPRFFGPWFSAALGREGFRHFGIDADGKLVSTVAMFVQGGVAWTGFGATIPEYSGRGYQTARLVRLIQAAMEMECSVLHNESATGTPEKPNTTLRNVLKLGFHHIYNKDVYTMQTMKTQ